ncbi:MAG: PH domain-containing protein [Rhodothermales bacterium]|nr:PH domain-containing protein [Rhodothermales bacterium]
MRPLDPAIQTVWTIKLAVLWTVIVLGVLTYDVLRLFDAGRTVPAFVPTLAALAAGLAVTLAVPRLRYRYWRFDLRAEELYLERGIWNRVRTVVPLRRIQHLDVSQDVIERSFELGKLIVHTAGTRSSDVVLPGLHITEAERLRDEVKHSITEDAV